MVVCSLHKTTKIWVCVNLVWYGNVAVPWLRLLHSGCSPRRPRFSPSQVHLGFVVDKVALPSITLVSPVSCQHTITPRPYFHPSRLCINSETHMSLSTPLTKGRVQPDKHNLWCQRGVLLYMVRIFFALVNVRHELLRDRSTILEFAIFYCELINS